LQKHLNKYEGFVAAAAGGSKRGRVKEAAKSKESPPAKVPRQTSITFAFSNFDKKKAEKLFQE